MIWIVAIAITIIFAVTFWWPFDTSPRCACGSPAAYYFSDGTWECDGCREARLNGKAPKP